MEGHGRDLEGQAGDQEDQAEQDTERDPGLADDMGDNRELDTAGKAVQQLDAV